MMTFFLERKVKSSGARAMGHPPNGSVLGLKGSQPNGSSFFRFPRQYSLHLDPVYEPRITLLRVQGRVE